MLFCVILAYTKNRHAEHALPTFYTHEKGTAPLLTPQQEARAEADHTGPQEPDE